MRLDLNEIDEPELAKIEASIQRNNKLAQNLDEIDKPKSSSSSLASGKLSFAIFNVNSSLPADYQSKTVKEIASLKH